MYMRQGLRLYHASPVRKGAVCWTRYTHLRGSGISIVHFSSQFRHLSDHKAHRMSKKALILIADGTEEIIVSLVQGRGDRRSCNWAAPSPTTRLFVQALSNAHLRTSKAVDLRTNLWGQVRRWSCAQGAPRSCLIPPCSP